MDLTLLESLAALLDQEDAIYREMGVALCEEHEALLKMAAPRVASLAARKETLALRVKALDESRKVLARRLGTACGLPPGEVTVSALCAAAPPPAADRLRQAGERLRATVLDCQTINRANAQAATRGMELVRGIIEHLIEHADPAGKLYHAPRARGYAAHAGSPGFVSREA